MCYGKRNDGDSVIPQDDQIAARLKYLCEVLSQFLSSRKSEFCYSDFTAHAMGRGESRVPRPFDHIRKKGPLHDEVIKPFLVDKSNLDQAKRIADAK